MSDPRLTPATDRVVADWRAAEFPALTPVAPEAMQVGQPVVDLCRAPEGARDRQLVQGAVFEVLEQRDGWAFGIAPMLGHYCGWVREDALGGAPRSAGHWLAVRQSHAYPAPDFKQHETCAISHGAQLACFESAGRFTRTDLGWVPTRHLTDATIDDPVKTAELYLGVPYLWGGNSIWGIDCSGLALAGCLHAGIDCPGDSDMQARDLGETLPPGTPPRRGDLMFWKGHVAWVADAETLLHANAFHMATAYEPIVEAIARIDAQGDGPVTRHARL